MERHTDDLRNVREGDTVEIVTSEDEYIFPAECTDFDRQQAAEETGEVRETRIWTFSTTERRFAASIVDGLESSSDDDLPQYSELWDLDREENMGYAEEVNIEGARVK